MPLHKIAGSFSWNVAIIIYCKVNVDYRAFITQLLHANLIAHTIVVEIHESAGSFSCKVEQPKAIAHKVWQGVGHL